uniref:hypothetical protein n=1 Tax=Alistipes sp. ZOR0009 TaxID=1339253 RepID=UPI001E462B74
VAGASFSNDACKATSKLLTSISGKLYPAAKAINPEYPPSVIKVASATPSPSRVLSEAGGATTTYLMRIG